MTKFNPSGKEDPTIGELLDSIATITDKDDAIQYKESYVRWLKSKSAIDAESLASDNIGYYAGYFGRDVRIRIEELFDCKHPILGKA